MKTESEYIGYNKYLKPYSFMYKVFYTSYTETRRHTSTYLRK